MKILLLGKDGQVGWELQRALAPLGEVIALGRDSPAPLNTDFSDSDALAAIVRTIAPQIIVNAAAHTAVDLCEREPDLARAINATAPGALAREASALGAWLLHFSTDYVFDGSGAAPWSESSPTGPLNVYGATKLAGEEAILASGCSHLILRTSWVYAARGKNFARTMLKLARSRNSLEVVNDQFGAPTGADLLADVSAHCLRTALNRSDVSGVYHAVAHGETSWHGYARHIIAFALAAGQPLLTTPKSIVAVPSQTLASQARRPNNSRMNTSKLTQTFGLTMPPWQLGVNRMLSELIEQD